MEKKRIEEIISNALMELGVAKDASGESGDQAELVLFGREGALDSLGLVNLLVGVEQKIEEETGTVVTVADERAMSLKKNPFKTVERLASYIETLLQEEKE